MMTSVVHQRIQFRYLKTGKDLKCSASLDLVHFVFLHKCVLLPCENASRSPLIPYLEIFTLKIFPSEYDGSASSEKFAFSVKLYIRHLSYLIRFFKGKFCQTLCYIFCIHCCIMYHYLVCSYMHCMSE